MFARERDYSAFLQTVRIDVGTLVGLKTDEDAYIVLKELPTLERKSDAGGHQGTPAVDDNRPQLLRGHEGTEEDEGGGCGGACLQLARAHGEGCR